MAVSADGRPPVFGFGLFLTADTLLIFLSYLPPTSTMASASQPPKRREGLLSTLDVVIQASTLAKDTCGIPPAQAVFGSVSVLLTLIRVRFPPLCGELLAHVNLGHHGERPGLYRPRAVFR